MRGLNGDPNFFVVGGGGMLSLSGHSPSTVYIDVVSIVLLAYSMDEKTGSVLFISETRRNSMMD